MGVLKAGFSGKVNLLSEFKWHPGLCLFLITVNNYFIHLKIKMNKVFVYSTINYSKVLNNLISKKCVLILNVNIDFKNFLALFTSFLTHLNKWQST